MCDTEPAQGIVAGHSVFERLATLSAQLDDKCVICLAVSGTQAVDLLLSAIGQEYVDCHLRMLASFAAFLIQSQSSLNLAFADLGKALGQVISV